ncbi:acetyl-CoA carboxylase carboxyltransferase subunit alpha [bacterium]|nr:acetyl-CoA carboxylase carboxyltransferase subunit alpha [bacterium]
MASAVLDFEKPFVELDDLVQETQRRITEWSPQLKLELRELKRKRIKLYREIYPRLNSWQRTQLARHPERPYTLDYVSVMCEEFTEIHGDRRFRDDPAIVAFLARMGRESLVIIGHQKGRGTKENIYRNFGMPNPEGYRKALRVMQIAEKFGLPVLTLIDTPGAYPGIGAEERGQAEAIARNLYEMSCLKAPIISLVIGEGGSGGALGIGLSDRILMLESSIYSVISPEACAAILWKDKEKAKDVAQALKMTARDLERLKIIDEVVKEPFGGAHRDYKRAAHIVRRVVRRHLSELKGLPVDELIAKRYEKYRGIGVYLEG